jgi:hypothetical protein
MELNAETTRIDKAEGPQLICGFQAPAGRTGEGDLAAPQDASAV